MCGQTLETSSAKNLGLILYHIKMRLKPGINALIENLKVIYNVRQLLTIRQKIYLGDRTVLSLFSLADSVYGPYFYFDDRRRVQVQNSCLHLMFGIGIYIDVSILVIN